MNISIIFLFFLPAWLVSNKHSVSIKSNLFHLLNWVAVIFMSFLIMTIFLFIMHFCFIESANNFSFLNHLFYLNKEWCFLMAVNSFIFKFTSPLNNDNISKETSNITSNTTSTLNPYFVTGYTDGEGCFAINIFKSTTTKALHLILFNFYQWLH